MVVEIGLITPPVGMNVFIISGMVRSVPMVEIFKAVMPFLVSDLLRVALLVFVPSLSLVLLKLIPN
jgi:TRAP-type C4-dicarboxylate transport system permease large subunit